MKLGQLLIQDGLIDPAQLQRALDAQLIYGGHLGTCLIELGMITEAQLGRVLSRAFGVRYADAAAFHEIPRYVVRTVPASVAERHVAVPFAIDANTLSVALLDPGNLVALDELQFASGHSIDPCVAPEARLFQALERYYAVPRRTRYVALCNRLDRDEREGFVLQRVERERPATAADRAEVTTDGSAMQAGMSSTGSRDAVALAEPLPTALRAAADPLAEVAEAMCHVEHRDQLARTVIAACASGMARRVLFKIVRGQARVWAAGGGALETAELDEVRFDVLREPTFALMRDDGIFYGPIESAADHESFYSTLGLRPADAALLVPVHLNDQLVAVLYGDGGSDEPLDVDPGLYRRLARKLAIGLNIELLRRRLRTV